MCTLTLCWLCSIKGLDCGIKDICSLKDLWTSKGEESICNCLLVYLENSKWTVVCNVTSAIWTALCILKICYSTIFSLDMNLPSAKLHALFFGVYKLLQLVAVGIAKQVLSTRPDQIMLLLNLTDHSHSVLIKEL